MLKYIENKEAEEKIAGMNAEQVLSKIAEIKIRLRIWQSEK